MLYVHNKVPIVQKYPSAFCLAFSSNRFKLKSFSQVVFDLFDDRFYLSFSFCRRKEERIGDSKRSATSTAETLSACLDAAASAATLSASRVGSGTATELL